MTELILAGILAALRSPDCRKEIVTLLGDIWLYIEHRKSANPDLIAQSDAAWAKLAAATTPEERLAAHQAIQALQASPGA